MNAIFDFWFSSIPLFWAIITSSWILAFPVLASILCLVVMLIKGSFQKGG